MLSLIVEDSRDKIHYHKPSCASVSAGTTNSAGSLRRRSAERPCTLLQGIPNPLASSRGTLTDAAGVWAGGGVTTANLLVRAGWRYRRPDEIRRYWQACQTTLQ